MTDLSNKTCIVTGAAQGIGKSIATAFANAKASVILCDVQEDAGRAAETEIRNAGGVAEFRLCDVSDTNAVNETVAYAISTFGALDVVVNNAAILPKLQPITEQDDEAWNRVLDVNFGGALRFFRAAIPHMSQKNRGVFITISSVHATHSLPGFGPYAASKGALVSLSRQLAVEFGPHNIRFVTLSPGAISTEMTLDILRSDETGRLTDEFKHMHLLERIGSPEEVAAAAVFLASDGASFITGEDILVDGGLTRATRVGAIA